MKKVLKKCAVICASVVMSANMGFAQIEVDNQGNAIVGTAPSFNARLVVNNGPLRVGHGYSPTDRAQNMIKIGDSDYVQIGEWEVDDMLSFKAKYYNFTNGGVGIGLTNNALPSQKLHVVGNSYVNGNSYVSDNLGVGTTLPSQKLHVEGNSYLNGNLGVGIATTSQKLHIVGNSFFDGNTGMGAQPNARARLLLNNTTSTATDSVIGLHSTVKNTNSSLTRPVIGIYSQNTNTTSQNEVYGAYFKNTQSNTGSNQRLYGIRLDNKNYASSTYTYGLRSDNDYYGTNNTNYGAYFTNYNYGANNTNYGIFAYNSNFNYDNVTIYGYRSNVDNQGASGKAYGVETHQSLTNTSLNGTAYSYGLYSTSGASGVGETWQSGVQLRNHKSNGSGWMFGIKAYNESTGSGDVTMYGADLQNIRTAGTGLMIGIDVSNTNSSGTTYGAYVSSTSSDITSSIYNIYSTVSGGNPNFRYSGYFTGGKFVVMNGDVGIGKNPTLGMLDVAGNIYANGNFVASDERLKSNIKDVTTETEKLYKLQGKSYIKTIAPTFEIVNDTIREKKYETEFFEYGYLAQELKEFFPELVSQDTVIGYYAVNYTALIPIIVEALKDQRKTIETLQTGVKPKEEEKQYEKQYDIESLLQRIEALENTITGLTNCCANNSLKSMNTNDASAGSTGSLTTGTAIQEMCLSDANIDAMKLYQNAPNPFNERTTIKCYVPERIQKAQLCVYTMQGVQVQCLTITERGSVEIVIEAGTLSSGIYSYVLIGDGAATDAKQMILTK